MQAVALPHFSHPCLAVIWRNWNRVPVERLAKVGGMGLYTVLNYFGQRFFAFRNKA